ncbi:MAG: CotH kinase family protein [Myxococcales bacterium]|nr:CotH kinase family protein [Myxococcales bacterium]
MAPTRPNDPHAALRNVLRPLLLGVVIALMASCSSEPEPEDSPPDETAALYDPATLLQVDITMAVEDWAFVRQDKRDFTGVNMSCPKAPFPNTYQWRPASTVTINGRSVSNVHIRKKGFIGSVNSVKPSIKLKFDAAVDGQQLFGTTRMTLNNSVQDPSLMVQCLTYDLTRKSGLPAPRCNFAEVTVNGEALGIYANIEPMKKPFLRRSFGNDKGHLYEGTLSDFRDDSMVTFEAKTGDTDPTLGPIKAITAALKLPDEKLMAALEPLVDIDAFCTFWATSILIGNADSYFTKGNNYFIYFDPEQAGRGHFIPWGADATFGSAHKGAEVMGPQARPMLARRLYMSPAGQKRFLAAMSKLLAGPWNESAVSAEVTRIEALIGAAALKTPYLPAAKGGKGGATSKPYDFKTAVATVQSFIAGRRAMAKLLLDNPPEWTRKLSTKNCSDDPKTAFTAKTSGTFVTTYGTTTAKDPFAVGSGSLVMDTAGKAQTASTVGAVAGQDTKRTDRFVVELNAEVTSTKSAVRYRLWIVVPKTQATPGATIQVSKDGGGLAGAIAIVDAKTGKATPAAELRVGSLTLSKVGLQPDSAVAGSFDLTWGQVSAGEAFKACFGECFKKSKDAAACKKLCMGGK